MKEYHIWFVVGFLVGLMAVLEARVRLFFIFAALCFAIGFAEWIRHDAEQIKNKKRQTK